MEDIVNENSQLSLANEIFSQYDDNFATEDCLKSFENNFRVGSNGDTVESQSGGKYLFYDYNFYFKAAFIYMMTS